VITGVLTLVVPTIQTIVRSFQGPGRFGHSGSVGLSNYSALLGHGEFWHALAFSLSLGITLPGQPVTAGVTLLVRGHQRRRRRGRNR
jgi:ABC-type spermidine/putrescine transport system permease subunit II